MHQNINRIDHLAWITHPDNQEAYVEKLSELFRTKFDGPLIRDDLGVRIWASWESGLEVFAPYGDSEHARPWWDRLNARGEGFLAVIFGVPDVVEAREHVLRLGYKPSDVIEATGQEPWRDKLETFKEIIVGEVLGTTIAFGQIVYADGVIQGPAQGT